MSNSPENAQPESVWLTRLNRCLPAYHFESYVGRAGMGHLFKARQKSLERDVAVKVISRESGGDENFRKAFESAAKAMARLNHPNLISVFDSGHLDDMSYMVMEYVSGGSLHDAAQGMKIDPAEAVRVIRDVCLALAFAHENGVIHRDIKPANIFLTPNAKPKLGGFGPPRPPVASGEIPAGAGAYSAPELCGHPERADHRSDLYAVGAILYELVSGRVPEPADGQLPGLTDCPASLLPVCQRAMHPDPGHRYPDANAFNVALQEWQNQQVRKPPQPGKQIRKPAPGPPPRRNGPPTPTSPIAQRPQTTRIFAPTRHPWARLSRESPTERLSTDKVSGNTKNPTFLLLGNAILAYLSPYLKRVISYMPRPHCHAWSALIAFGMLWFPATDVFGNPDPPSQYASLDNAYATVTAHATCFDRFAQVNVSIENMGGGDDMMITTTPVDPDHGYYNTYISAEVSIDVHPKDGVKSISPTSATKTVGQDAEFLVTKANEDKPKFKVYVQGWRPHIETLLNGRMTIPDNMTWPNKSGDVFTGSLVLKNRNGIDEGTWQVDCGGAIYIDTTTQLNPKPDQTGRTTDTVLDAFYAGITNRKPTGNHFDEMGPWKYTCPNQPIGRNYCWIHEDYDEHLHPGTHGCVGIRGQDAFAGHNKDRAHVAEFHAKMAAYLKQNLMPDWDHTLDVSPPCYYIWKSECPHK